MTTIQRTSVVSKFSCLGDKCPDTCCRGWSMQLDEKTLTRYKEQAPELLVAVEPGEGAVPWIMRKNPTTTYCVKYEGGLCGIHKNYGDAFLGDACHFYPRVTRRLGDKLLMSATPSCPEITRLAFEAADAEFVEGDIDRLPESLKDYLPDGMTSDDALSVHRTFLTAALDNSASAETIFARIASVARSLERLDRKDWAAALPMYLRLADGRLPTPELNAADPFNLLHALMGLIVASQKPMSERLSETLAEMEKALAVTLDWQQVLILASENSAYAWQDVHNKWQSTWAAHFEPTLRVYLYMQLSMALFPFAGLGHTLTDRVTLIGVRLATIKLAIMCCCVMSDNIPPQEVVVRVVQSLSRFLDHLGDPAFSLQIYTETGWVREARMLGLLSA